MSIEQIPGSPLVRITCNQCERTIQIEREAELPWPWSVVMLLEEGEYHACCEGCASLLLKKDSMDSS